MRSRPGRTPRFEAPDSPRWPRRRRIALLSCVLAFFTRPALAQLVAAEPVAPIEVPPPADAPPIEVQVVLQLVIDAKGRVESAVATSRAPADAPDPFVSAAIDAARAARFMPSTRDGRPLRSRIEYVVVFHAPDARAAPAAPSSPPAPVAAPSRPTSTNEQDEDYAQVVQVRGKGWSSPRGLGDVRIKRELLEASPRQQTSEMLSAAPGFFVDHEDGEGLGNDVYLRGFDLDHGSGIEMRVGSIPVNIPTHIQGQGYADANFIIPEVVRSIRVLEGPYDPRQGDAAIVGSAYFDLGVAERGYQLKTTYGSFGQARVVGIAAPPETDEETFAAFALRRSDGFGEDRASQSGGAMAQYGFDIGPRDHLRLLATAYAARESLAGVVREDDVNAGRLGFYDAYPYLAQNQGIQSSRFIVGADFDHVAPSGARFEFAPFIMWTDFHARQNFTGDIQSSQIEPSIGGLGDLFETTNVETAGGFSTRFHTAPLRIGDFVEITGEPGILVRAGHTDQTKSLLDPAQLFAWDRRIDAGLDTLDAGAYIDVDVRLGKRLRISGGPRADLLVESVDDRLANVVPPGVAPAGALPGARRNLEAVAAGPRVTAEYAITPSIAPVVSYGEGFRSLGENRLLEGASPYSKVRSLEGGMRAASPRGRYTTTLAVFETWVGNELVFEAEAGGLETEGESLRRGVVGSFVAKPVDWLLVSTALSVNSAVFATNVPGVAHFVPNVPAVLFRGDATVRGPIARLRGKPVSARAGVGYTLLGGRHVNDRIIGPTNNVLNAGAGVRYGWLELGVDAFNVLGLRYADDEEVYVSNWSVHPGPQPASVATHITAAPPRTVLATVALYF
jgi:iron complex outermembrane recepter protein